MPKNFEEEIQDFAQTIALQQYSNDPEMFAVCKDLILHELRVLGPLKFKIQAIFVVELEKRCGDRALATQLSSKIDFKNKTVVELAAAFEKFSDDKTLCSNPATVQEDWARFVEPYESELVKRRRQQDEELVRLRSLLALRSQGTFPDKSSGGSGPPSPSLKA